MAEKLSDKYRKQVEVARQAATQSVEDQPDIGPPGPVGSVGRFLAGVVQGEMDPARGAATAVGLPWEADPQLEAVSGTTAGEAGRLFGNVVNPTWELFKPIDLIAKSIRYGGPVVRGLAHIAANALKGAGGGAVMPGEDRGSQAEVGGAIGGLLGLPGSIARGLSFKNVPEMLRAMESHSPDWLRKTFDAARQLSMPAFNRTWYRHVLEPLELKEPEEVGRKGMSALDDMLGKEFDKATAGMTFDATAGTPAALALAAAQRSSVDNLLSVGNAARSFSRIVTEAWKRPLAFNLNKLNSDQLQEVASNLKSRIDAIRPFSPENRALKRELENFRHTIFDEALGTPEQKLHYRNAREAWRRFAIGRDAMSPTEPYFSPADILRQMDRRSPFEVPLGRAAGQDIAEAGQNALLLPGRAAGRVQAGKSPMPTSIVPLIPGLAGASAQNWSPTGGVAP